MKLHSTKTPTLTASLKEAVFKGLPPDNGLYMPDTLPVLDKAFYEGIDKLSFQQIAFEVSKALIGDDLSEGDLKKIIEDVLTFEAPVKPVHDALYVLELFHGPSCAFKDFGARFMARLMSHFLQEEKKQINILVATSGDTGSAVAQGFLGMPGIHVTILYPSGKVSEIQEKQLTTLGQNITALEVQGTFDDCQRMVKEAFLDGDLAQKMNLSSANSINISRLIPQSFYYFYAYAQMKRISSLPVAICVPSGNFGNLCGGLFAKRMGLPIHHFVAATNANDIIPSYLSKGLFEPKASVQTISNAMDVGNPSNFQRMEALFGGDLEAMRKEIKGYSFTDAQTRQAMKDVFERSGYVMCPHTAVGYLGMREYLATEGKGVNGVFLSTASPAKFVDIVEETIGRKIDIPAQLVEAMKRPKKAILIGNTFAELKKFLLK